jgi:hydroxypyruvate reductase
MEKQRKDLLAIYQAAIGAVAGDQVVEQHLRTKYKHDHKPCHVIAIGKVADAMMRGALNTLEDKLLSGLVISKADTFSKQIKQHPRIHCTVGDHPIPAENSVNAGQELLHYIETLPLDADCLVLISGGTSSLVEVLAEGLSLQDLHHFNHYLLASGHDIHRINAVRKRLSSLKNGGLWQFLQTRNVSCLMISDVSGDDPAVIGSGLLFHSPPQDSLQSLLPSDLYTKLPPSQQHNKTPQNIPDSFNWKIIACLDDAKQAAKHKAQSLGYFTCIMPEFMQGSADAMGQHAVAVLQDAEAELLIWGGETTVKLPENCDKGGRNQQLALSAAIALQGKSQQYVLAIATDGVDGTTQEAGALVDGRSMQRGELFGLSAIESLKSASATFFLEESGDLIYTGDTQTNVMDLLIALKIEDYS